MPAALERPVEEIELQVVNDPEAFEEQEEEEAIDNITPCKRLAPWKPVPLNQAGVRRRPNVVQAPAPTLYEEARETLNDAGMPHGNVLGWPMTLAQWLDNSCVAENVQDVKLFLELGCY
ncbi:hypothetical protein AbraIFM66951_003045 [Aspergillus brasiliensis]|uniref:Uncharacterized protein n=1 Tax=Aspergillus brasiliensis TaxID=319629 RepID=A0A9W5YNI0_9EURO|nr:hypothetical protein AbraCBS73388_006361 [Aspergillus brasiliensis]GKZ42897.1 hypothetical protein AbraIFM66951_003045 [Aspergillus brasiliensis]